MTLWENVETWSFARGNIESQLLCINRSKYSLFRLVINMPCRHPSGVVVIARIAVGRPMLRLNKTSRECVSGLTAWHLSVPLEIAEYIERKKAALNTFAWQHWKGLFGMLMVEDFLGKSIKNKKMLQLWFSFMIHLCINYPPKLNVGCCFTKFAINTNTSCCLIFIWNILRLCRIQ